MDFRSRLSASKPPFFRTILMIGAVTALSLSGCGQRNHRLPSWVAAAPAPSPSPVDEIDDPAEIDVAENLPKEGLSREELKKRIAEKKKEYPRKIETKPPTSPKPSTSSRPAIDTRPEVPTLLNDNTRVALPTVRPEISPAKPEKKPEPKPEPKPTKPETKPEAKPAKPEPVPAPVPAPVDNGTDPEDVKADEEYSGPKEVALRPRSTAEFQLSEIAAQLGDMDHTTYLRIQKDTIGSALKACNYFLATALIEARVAGEDMRLYMAGDFDTQYFEPKGWKRITVETMKKWFREGRSFDVAIQRNPPPGKAHGHVAIPIGLNARGETLVAEAVYRAHANRIVTYTDSALANKYKIYVRY